MSKDKETRGNEKVGEIKFVGQPIFKQIISLIDAVTMQSLILIYNSDHYYKAFKSRMHVVTMCCLGY